MSLKSCKRRYLNTFYTHYEEIIIVQKSYGKMRGSRKKMRKPEKATLTEMLKRFDAGDKVHVVLRSNSSFQHPRFHGRTGTVLGKAGKSYIVEVRDGSLMKKLYLTAENLKKG